MDIGEFSYTQFQADIEAVVRRHLGDAPQAGAAVVVFSAVLDSGDPDSFAGWAAEMRDRDEWRVEPTQLHDVMAIVVDTEGRVKTRDC